MPRVSVVIPTYNHAHYLPYAVQSVLRQTYADWEAIVVDDGSTDDTADVVARFTDPRIRYIYQENQGLPAARNTGIRAAQSDYLAFLDADDEWEPGFLRRCIGVLSADSTLTGVYTRNYFIDEHGQPLPRLGGQVVPPTAFRSRILQSGLFPAHAALVRADVIREIGHFDIRLTSLEDWDLWIRLSARYQMQGISEPLARYRVYPGSMSTNAARMHANRMAVLTKHFGPPEGDSATWCEEKRRAYGFAYRSAAFGYIQQDQPDEGWRLLAQAASIWPHLLGRLDTFYELACDNQPKGYRGQADLLDIEGNGAEMLKRLDGLFVEAGPPLEPLRRAAYGNAYLALGILSDQAGRWAAARRCLFKAVLANQRLLGSYSVIRRLLKLCAGHHLAHLGRLLSGGGQQTPPHDAISISSLEV
jgi:glycosyltransferase involved in cell wall biosynthesis